MILKSDIFPKEVYTILDMTYDHSNTEENTSKKD